MTCASDTAQGVLPSQEFTAWITGHGIDAGSNAFTGGKWAGLVAQTAATAITAGGTAAEEGAAAEEAEVPPYSRSAYGRVPSNLRTQILGENPTCVYCGTSPANQVDHITSLKEDWISGGWSDEPVARTDRINDAGNLTGACASCNGAKGASPIGTGPGEWWPPEWPTGVWWPFGGP